MSTCRIWRSSGPDRMRSHRGAGCRRDVEPVVAEILGRVGVVVGYERAERGLVEAVRVQGIAPCAGGETCGQLGVRGQDDATLRGETDALGIDRQRVDEGLHAGNLNGA